MTCRAEVATTSLLIDFALVPKSVTVNGVSKPFKAAGTRYQWSITGVSLAKGQSFTLQVRYDDIPWNRVLLNRGTRGVIENGTVTTFSGEPEVAVFWYPSNDRIDNKATYAISISTQKANQIIAYGAPAPHTFGDGSMVNTRIVIPERVSSYNPGLTVGPGLAVKCGKLTAAGVSVPYLYAGITVFCGLGIYATSGSTFDLLMLLGVGLVGFLMRMHDYPLAPLIIGMVLGPLAETSLRDALISADGDASVLVSGPIVLVLYGVLVIILLLTLRSKVTSRTRRDV